MSTPEYVLDSNVFIEAKKSYYALDVAPGFWEALSAYVGEQRLVVIAEVEKDCCERYAGECPLKDWFVQELHDYCRPDQGDEAVISSYAAVMAWVNSCDRYELGAKAKFAAKDEADGWVIAYALAHGLTVVTQERYNSKTSKVQIPVVCEGLGVKYIDTLGMMRALDIKLGWISQHDQSG